MATQKKLDLIHEKTGKLFLRYLFPSLLATIMISVNFFIDALCIGQKLGENGLAALSIAQPVQGLLYALGYLFGIGGGTLYSIYSGRGERDRAYQYYGTSMTAVVFFAGVAAVAGLLFLAPVTAFLGGQGGMLTGAIDYNRFVLLLAPFYSLETFFSIFTRNDRAPRLAMGVTFLCCILNMVLDVYFIFVLEWGMGGAGLATSLAVTVAVVVQIGAIYLRKGSGLRLRRFRFRWRRLWEIVRSGTPSFLLEMTGSVVTLTFNTVLLRISGVTAVAVYGVVSNLTIMVTSAINGVANAMQPLVSANAGVGKALRVRRLLRIAVFTAFGVAALCAAVGLLCTQTLIGFFIQADANFLSLAIPAVRIVSISYLLVSANYLLTVYFQSVQADNQALSMSVLQGVVLPVVCVIGCAFYGGITGAWGSTILSECLGLLCGLFFLSRVNAGLRQKNYQHLNFFGKGQPEETLDQILDQLGAEDLGAYVDLIHYCNSRDEETQGIPAYIGLDDLTSDYEGDYDCAEQDRDMGLLLAVGGLLFTDMYEQNEAYMRDKQLDLNWPAAAPAMSALAEKCFRFDREEGRPRIVRYSEIPSPKAKHKEKIHEKL